MALHSLYCADVPLRNCSLTHSLTQGRTVLSYGPGLRSILCISIDKYWQPLCDIFAQPSQVQYQTQWCWTI